MKIVNLSEGHVNYTSNAYLITGSLNKPGDVNALIDTGRDPIIIENLLKVPKGIGKKAVEAVVITHCHYDHKELLPRIKEMFKSHFDTIIADRVRYTAIGFWERMGFDSSNNGNYVWKRCA